MRHEYLAALHESGSAPPESGMDRRSSSRSLARRARSRRACPVYVKDHSYGEYVFDWAWANAYQQHGLAYYPKAAVAVPFTPVPGARLLARDAQSRARCWRRRWWPGARSEELSSLHLLFGVADTDIEACDGSRADAAATRCSSSGRTGARLRATSRPSSRASRTTSARRSARSAARWPMPACASAGRAGPTSRAADWDFFYRCYARTYREHGNPPYLKRDFFHRMADTLPEAWLLFVAEREGKPIATSLIALAADGAPAARSSPTAATGARSNASTACTSRLATTSRWRVVHRARRAALRRAARRASTRWRVP